MAGEFAESSSYGGNQGEGNRHAVRGILRHGEKRGNSCQTMVLVGARRRICVIWLNFNGFGCGCHDDWNRRMR